MADTSSSAGEVEKNAKPSVGPVEKPTSSPLSDSMPMTEIDGQKFLDVMTATLSLSLRAGMKATPVNYGTDRVLIRLECPQGVRVCPGGTSHKAHLVLLGAWDDVTGMCQEHAHKA